MTTLCRLSRLRRRRRGALYPPPATFSLSFSPSHLLLLVLFGGAFFFFVVVVVAEEEEGKRAVVFGNAFFEEISSSSEQQQQQRRQRFDDDDERSSISDAVVTSVGRARHFSLKHRKIDLSFREEEEEDFDDEEDGNRTNGSRTRRSGTRKAERRRGLKQSSSAGLELNGKARDTGYFYATLTIGTPGQQFEVIVDTGSTYTFVTCYPCVSCGQHGSNAPYDAAKSSSYERVPCGSGCIFGGCRSSGLCEYDEQFSEESQVGGHVVSDVIDVGGSLGTPRIHFGCNTLETNMLRTQKANGMIALGRTDAALHRQLKKKAYPPGSYDGTFGLCLGSFEGGGVLSLGKLPEQHYANFVTRKTNTRTVKLVKGSKAQYYNVDVTRMFVRNTELKKPNGADLIDSFRAGYGTVLDSGTTYTYLHEDIFIPFISEIEDKVQNDHGANFFRVNGGDPNYPNDVCWRNLNENKPLSTNNVNYLFPTFNLTFVGVNEEELSIQFPPENYLFVHPSEANAFCVGVFDNGKQGSIIGGIFARNTLFEFDDESEQQTVKISPNVDCDGLRSAMDFDMATGATRHPPPPPAPRAPEAPGTPGTGFDRDRAKEAREQIMFKIMVGGFIIVGTLFFALVGLARVYLWKYKRYRQFSRWMKLQDETDEFNDEDNEEVFSDTENAFDDDVPDNKSPRSRAIEMGDLRNLSSEERAILHREKMGNSNSSSNNNSAGVVGAIGNVVGSVINAPVRLLGFGSRNTASTDNPYVDARAPRTLREQTLPSTESIPVSEGDFGTRTGRLTESAKRNARVPDNDDNDEFFDAPLSSQTDLESHHAGVDEDVKAVWRRFNLK
jgi:hypothetical protein